jgi:hypothetical protein
MKKKHDCRLTNRPRILGRTRVNMNLLLMWLSEKTWFVLSVFQVIRSFGLFRCIAFAMHLDIHYV